MMGVGRVKGLVAFTVLYSKRLESEESTLASIDYVFNTLGGFMLGLMMVLVAGRPSSKIMRFLDLEVPTNE